MRVIKAEPGAVLNLGRLGENESTAVTFDVGAWLAEYPEAGITVVYRLPGTVSAYPVSPGNVSLENGVLTWTITSAELAKEGTGEVELVATENGIVAKTVIWAAKVNTALDGAGPAPAPWQSWQTAMAEIAAEAEQSAQAAEIAMEAVQDMGAEAVTLPAGSTAAVTKAVDPDTGAVTLTFGIPKGDKGDTGETGQTGATGNGIASATLNQDYTLTLTYTNGQSTTVGPIRGAQGPQGETGQTGATGNGIATITKTGSSGLVDTYTITFTNGQSAVFTVTNGEDGTDGVSPTVTITSITGGHTVTVTDAQGSHAFNVMDGAQGETGATGRRGTGVWVIAHSPSVYTTPVGGIVPVARIALSTVLADTGLGAVYVDDIMHYGSFLFNTGYVDSEYVYFTSATNTAGQTGTAATIAVGTVTTLPPGSSATVTNSGTSAAAVFDIGIPQGATGPSGEMADVPVSGTDPVIAAAGNTRYVCGECYTLSFTPSAAGTCAVLFESGSTPTVLTLPATVKMPDWWTGVEAGYTYEISVAGGVWGAVMAWAT